jgi:uncharacterized delta-60 repeat protein/uncharacterized repeat protein (TIGR01451 family)
MLHVQVSKTRRAARSWIALWFVAAVCAGSALESMAQPAPPNDNLTNAQVILGVSGTVQGTNISATVEPGEPAPVPGIPAQSTIWYVWTAPISAEIDFNTRGSTDPDGLPLDTTLGVYVLAGKTLNDASLVQVAGNVEDPSGGVTSRVDFNATLGTTYFIQVGSIFDTNNGFSQGYPDLNWAPSIVAGGFGFSAPVFQMSSMENYIPDDSSNSIAPSLFGLPAGSANARITVSRTGGNVGRCEVTLNVLPGTYTNYYFTNYVITNLYITNYSSNGMVLGFTNIFLTNVASVNNFADFEYPFSGLVDNGFGYTFIGFSPGIVYDPVDVDMQIVATNINGEESVPITNFITGFGSTPFGLPFYFTNFPCNAGATITVVSNNGVTTATVTEVICNDTATNAMVPSAIADVQLTAFSTNLIFDDYQMSQDVYLQIYPILDPNSPFGERPNSVAVEDFYTPGPEDAFYALDPDYSYYALSSLVQLSLTNLVLDPQEDPDIVPPAYNTQSNACVDIQNYWDAPFQLDNPLLGYSNDAALFYTVINFERYSYRCNKNCGTAAVFAQRTLRGINASQFVRYTIDSKVEGITVIDDNVFATVADSDYAIPFAGQTNQTDYDFTLPTANSQGWTGIYGTLTFPPLSIAPEAIYIPITNNGAVEFDEDIELEFFFLPPTEEVSQTEQTPSPAGALLGVTRTARLTINFNNIATDLVQPGGAVDRNYNVDFQADSQPPGNTEPGANSSVNAVAIQPSDGMAVIGGDFDGFNGTTIYYLARLQINGFLDNTFAAGLGRGPNSFVNAIAIDSSNRIVIGGNFNSVNQSNAFYIARLNVDGSLDTSFNTGHGFNSFVYALAIDANGNILVGGDFTSFDTTNCNHIARLLPNGGLDTSFLPSSGVGVTNGTDQDVLAVTVDNLGKVVIGGAFSMVNGTNWSHIGRLLTNGSVDTSFNPGLGADGNVLALAVQPDNSIILGGAFHNFDLISRNSIARLTPGGVLDTGFAPGSGFNDIVFSLAVQPADGNILVGGQFTTYNGNRRVAMARLLGGQGSQFGEAGWLDTSFMDTAYDQFAGLINHYYNTNAYNANDYPPYNYRNQVLSMGLQTDGNIVIGGNFYRVGGGFTRVDVHNHQNVARVIGAATHGPDDGGIGNFPGNVGLTQSPYSVDDTGQYLFVTLDRQNGSLGPATLTLGTNTLPPSSSSATSADFGLLTAVATYETVYDITPQGPAAYGWRMTDGEYGFNNNIQTIPDNGASDLFLSIKNDPANPSPVLYADINLLNLNANNLVSLGGVTIPFGPALGQYSSQLDIINDNFPAGTIGFSASNYNVLESGGAVTLTLLRTNGSYGRTSVTVNTKNGTAREGTAQTGADYTFTSQQVVFENGVTSNTIPITILDHNTQQTNKFFIVYLSSPTGGATLDTNIPPLVPSNTVVTIIDDHFLPGYLSFSSPTYSVLKTGLATISVIRTGAAFGQLSVEVGTSNGTGINTVNYVGVTNTLTWTNQDISTKTITVQTLQDNTVEGPKTVNLFLFNPQVAGNSSPLTNAEVLASPSNAVLTIQDTDSYGNLNFLTPDFNIFQNGGQALITVTRTGGTVGNASINFKTFTPTNVQLPFLAAVAGSNYGATNGTLNFAPGVSSQSFSVPVYQQSETNVADRIVGLQLFSPNPTNLASQFPKNAILTILDPLLHINSAGSVDTTTQNGTGFNNVVNSLSLQPDGSILAGGEFTYFDGYPFDYVGRLLSSGYFDTGFLFNLSGANGTVWQVLSQAPSAGQIDGNIMIAGNFTQVNGYNSPNIARLELNGLLDTSFNPGAGADGTVYTIAQMFLPSSATDLTNEAYYVIGGTFANYDGIPASGVARVTPSGTFDPNFNLGTGVTGSNVAVHAIAITAANQILVGGDFTTFDNQVHQHLVQLNVDGTLDTNFTTDINGSVRAIVVQPDGRILIGGLFTTVNGSNFNYVARLNTDGTTDTNFNLGVGCNNNVEALALDSQLNILVGGSFTQAGGVTRNGLTRLNPDGTVDPSINFGFGANGFVDAIAVQTNGEIDVAGGFSTFDNIPENNFVRIYGGANAGDGSVQFSEQVFGVLESASNAVISLQRLGGTFGSPSVSAVFFTSNGTAISGVNYTGVTNTVSFPQGETFETVLVPIIYNSAIGPDLSVNLLLTNPPSNSEVIGPQVNATLIITNVNAGLEFSAPSYQESSTAGSAVIPIVRVGNPNITVSVTVYTGTNGSALPYTNYVPETNVLVFNQGVMTNYFLVPILNSPTTFQNTTVDLELEDASNSIVVSPSSATLYISSALTGPGFLTFSQTNYTVSEGATNAVITVLRTNGNANTVTVQLTTSNGTAIAGINYSNASALLTFLPGQNVATDNIPIIQLTNAVPNATVNLTLSDPTGGAVLTGLTNEILTIVNDIADFSFSSATYFVSEGAGSVTLTILRGGPTNTGASVSYATSSPTNASDTNGYAVPNVDYVPTNGTLNFPPGETLETIPVTILQGTVVNPVESFQVLLKNPSSGTLVGVPGTATVDIVSDVTGFAFATNSYVVGENGSNVVVTVNRLNANTGTLSVRFTTSDNTAINGVDYVATNGLLTFLDGQATENFTVTILNPNLVESNKSFDISLFSPSANSFVVSPSNTVVTITNVYVGLAFGSPSFSVSECAVDAVIPVELTGLTNSTIEVSFGTANGSGVAYDNYFPTNGTLEFLPGQTVAYFDVKPINNHVIGPDHTVVLNLTNNYPAPPSVAGVELLNPSTALLTIQECNGAYIIQSGTAFVTGSILPSTGVIYSNDTVTILLGLRDIAGGNTSNLVATLQASNGIASPSGPQTYGVLIENGPTVSRPFTFTALGSNGENIIATLALQDGPTSLGTVAFGFTVGGTSVSINNTNTIYLPETTPPITLATNSIAPGYGYPSLISVTGNPGLITSASVTLSNFGHSFPSDVDVVLEAPNGSNSILMSHCGGSFTVTNLTLTFNETALTSLPTDNLLTSGTYLPTTNSLEMPKLPPVPTNETVPVAPPQFPYPYGANLSAFLGTSPNGNWSLWAICETEMDGGIISNGWILNLSTGVPVENDSDLELTVNPVPAQATVSNVLTYFLTLTNFGPSAATNIVITDYLPAGGAGYLSNSCNCGTVTNGILTVSLPSLAVGAGTAFSIAVSPASLGYITNIVTALALEPDPNSNNMVTNVNLVSPPTAEVGISLIGSPNPVLVGGDVVFSVEVTNGGPSEAMNVSATVVLPPGFLPDTNGISASTGTATNVNGTITWTIGNLAFSPTGSGPTLTIATKATIPGIGLCTASASSSVYAPLKGLLFAAIKIDVTQPFLSISSVSHSYEITWSALATNYTLQGATNLPPQGTWIAIPEPPVINGEYTFSLPGTNGYHFFRLSAQLP